MLSKSEKFISFSGNKDVQFPKSPAENATDIHATMLHQWTVCKDVGEFINVVFKS